MALGFGAFLVGRGLRRLAEDGEPSKWVLGGLVFAAVGIATLAFGGLHRAFPVVPFGAGLVLYRAGIRPLYGRQGGDDGRLRRWRWVSLTTALGGLVLTIAGVYVAAALIGVLGAAALVVGLIALTLGDLRLGSTPLPPVLTIGAGAVLLVAGRFFWPLSRPGALPWLALLVLALIGGSFILKGEGVAAAILVAFLVAWILVDRVDDAPLDPNPDAPDRILALGDSYTSGEGASGFFPGTNLVGEGQNQCRRSSTAYPYLVASKMGMGLDFYACSGATSAQLYRDGQMGSESPDDVAGELPQLANIRPEDLSSISVVLVTIGGNDALFGDIGIACVLPGSCNAFRENWLVNVARIGPQIRAAFEAIKEKVGDDIPIVAVPYPRLINEAGCDWSAMEPSEHDFLFEFITVLNDRVRRSAQQAGVNYFEPGLFAFGDAVICYGGPHDTAMNFFNLTPTEGGLFDRLNPVNWVHGNFHPRPSGHELIAARLEPYLRSLLADIDAGVVSANPEPDPDAPFSVDRLGGIEPILVDPDSLTDLTDSTAACRADRTSAFATLLPLIDDLETFNLAADPDAPICHTRPDGTWTDDEEGVVIRSGGAIRIQPQIPSSGWFQRFVYRDTSDGTWRLRIVEFCVRKPNCPHDVDAWMADESAAAARAVTVPSLMILLGAWLVLLGGRRLIA